MSVGWASTRPWLTTRTTRAATTRINYRNGGPKVRKAEATSQGDSDRQVGASRLADHIAGLEPGQLARPWHLEVVSGRNVFCHFSVAERAPSLRGFALQAHNSVDAYVVRVTNFTA
jgi:hypothetical protein